MVYLGQYSLKTEDGVDKNDDLKEIEAGPDEEEAENVVVDGKREHHWRMVLDENEAGIYEINICYMIRGGI